MSFQQGYAGEFQGLTRLQIIQQILRGLGSPVATSGTDTVSDYSRYPKQDIIDKINEAQLQFVKKTGCLSTWAIVEAVANQALYRLPSRCLKVTEAKWYNATNNYWDLELIPDITYMKRISNTYKVDPAGTCQYLYPAYTYGNIKSFGIYPKPVNNGTTFNGSSFGVVTAMTGFTFNGDITGTHKAGYVGTAYMVDALGRDLTALGVTVGMMIFNATDGSSGQVTSIQDQDATNDRVNVTLAGGSTNLWNIGDSFQIPVGEYGVVIRANGTEEYAFSTEFGEIQDITPLSGNFFLDFIMRPLMIDLDTQYPEIPADYHSALIDYAVWKLGENEYNGLTMKDRAVDAKASWLESIDDYSNFSRMDVEPENTIEDRMRNVYGG